MSCVKGHHSSYIVGDNSMCVQCLREDLDVVIKRVDAVTGDATTQGQVRSNEEDTARVEEADAPSPGTCRKRYEDMSRLGCIHLTKRDNGDMILRIVPDPHTRNRQNWVGFCAQSGSPEVMAALRGLMVAIASDNQTNPQTRDPQG